MSRIHYCARCGRLDRMNAFGLCADCSALPNVIELELQVREPADRAPADNGGDGRLADRPPPASERT